MTLLTSQDDMSWLNWVIKSWFVSYLANSVSNRLDILLTRVVITLLTSSSERHSIWIDQSKLAHINSLSCKAFEVLILPVGIPIDPKSIPCRAWMSVKCRFVGIFINNLRFFAQTCHDLEMTRFYLFMCQIWQHCSKDFLLDWLSQVFVSQQVRSERELFFEANWESYSGLSKLHIRATEEISFEYPLNSWYYSGQSTFPHRIKFYLEWSSGNFMLPEVGTDLTLNIKCYFRKSVCCSPAKYV